MHASAQNFTPSRLVGFAIVIQLGVAFMLWSFSPTTFLPKPWEIGNAWMRLMSEGFFGDIVTSLLLTVEAILITAVVSLLLAYLSVVPKYSHYVKLWILLVTKLRFNSPVGLTLFFAIAAGSGHQLKLWLMVTGMTVWFVTSMVAEIAVIPKDQYDLARSLGMSEWEVLWEVVILGTGDRALEVIRQNAAMGWMMLTMVEGIVRTEGGVGAMLINQNKYLHLDAVFAIQITIIVIGVGIDLFLEFFRSAVCPYASLGKEKK